MFPKVRVLHTPHTHVPKGKGAEYCLYPSYHFLKVKELYTHHTHVLKGKSAAYIPFIPIYSHQSPVKVRVLDTPHTHVPKKGCHITLTSMFPKVRVLHTLCTHHTHFPKKGCGIPLTPMFPKVRVLPLVPIIFHLNYFDTNCILVLTIAIRANVVVPPGDNIHSYY